MLKRLLLLLIMKEFIINLNYKFPVSKKKSKIEMKNNICIIGFC